MPNDDWSHEETDERDGCAPVPFQFGLRSGSI
jgi:hypothetical protein